mmetsp:Transcript_88286/g.205400  ORF Transcript_88286/g.205400 Transcript_88286/m.205400 type:complete len:238 (-) Transcript_88286:526-1239(-)
MHFCDSLCSLIRRSETHKSKALAFPLVVCWCGHRGYGAEGLEQCTEGSLVGVLIQVLDVEIHSLLLGFLARRELVTELCQPLCLWLHALHVELPNWVPVRAQLLLLAFLLGLLYLLRSAQLLHVQFLNALQRHLARFKIDKGKLPAFGVGAQCHRSDAAKCAKFCVDLGLIPIVREALHIQIRVVGHVRLFAVPAFDELTHLYCFRADLHAIHTLNGLLCRLLGFVVHEAIAIGLAR